MPFPPNHCYLWNSRCKSVNFDQTNRNFSMTSLRSPIYCDLQRLYRTCRDFWDFSHFVPSYEVTNEYDMPFFFFKRMRQMKANIPSVLWRLQGNHWLESVHSLDLSVPYRTTSKNKQKEKFGADHNEYSFCGNISCWMCQWSATGKDVARWIAVLLLSLCAVHWHGCHSHRILKFPDFSLRKVYNLRSASLIC